jgi:hypothetical protein
MERAELSEYFAKMGRRGAEARVKSTTPEQRRRIARKASKRAAELRRLKGGHHAKAGK